MNSPESYYPPKRSSNAPILIGVGCLVLVCAIVCVVGVIGAVLYSNPQAFSQALSRQIGNPNTAATPFPQSGRFNHPYKITVETDRIKNGIVTRLNPLDSELAIDRSAPALEAFFISDGTVESASKVGIQFIAYSTNWKYEYENEVVFYLPRNERIAAKTVRQHSIEYGYKLEMLLTLLPTSDFYRIANSSNVDVKLFTNIFPLTAAQLEGLRDLASRMNPK